MIFSFLSTAPVIRDVPVYHECGQRSSPRGLKAARDGAHCGSVGRLRRSGGKARSFRALCFRKIRSIDGHQSRTTLFSNVSRMVRTAEFFRLVAVPQREKSEVLRANRKSFLD